ncbi:MAG: sigma-70 family RNA polymerase sigma factor [Phycisphaerales bacterium]|nr:MAG: sigma-70 family RNA polymerase sigma factor [Phycisphaerales bacterium]
MSDEGSSRGPSGDVTRLLADSAAGNDEARNRLADMVFAELHAMARVQMASERSGHTLGATALVSEAYLKLFRPPGDADGGRPEPWADRRAFFAAAVTAMRRVLIDHARAKLTEKRGGSSRRPMPNFDADAVAAAQTLDPSEFLSLDDAISRLEEVDERAAQVTRLRFFAGLSVEAVAELLGVSERTAIRDWIFARAWLRDRLLEEGST